MKKIIAFISFFVAFAAYSQTFQITYNGEPVGETLDFIATQGNSDNELVLIIQNNSEEVDSIYLSKHVIEEVPGSVNLFCIGDGCYDGNASTTPLVLEPGASSNAGSFHLLYNPGGTEGTTKVRYNFYTSSYSVPLIINFIYGNTGIEETDFSVNNLTAYPNPATSSVNVSYDLSGFRAGSACLVITNLVGSKVAVHSLNGTSGKVSMDVSNLDAGIYFYSIEADGKIVSTKKLIVK